MSPRLKPALVATVALLCAMVVKAQTPARDARSFPDIVDHFKYRLDRDGGGRRHALLDLLEYLKTL